MIVQPYIPIYFYGVNSNNMKATFLLLATCITVSLFAQTTGIGGRFKKSDGNIMKPPAPNPFPMIEFSDQLTLSNLTGGSDNSATIEFEVPTNTNVTEFRNMMNAGTTSSQVAVPKTKTVTPATTVKRDIDAKPSITMQQPQQVKIIRAEITVASSNPNQYPKNQLVKTIVLEEVTIESCTDDAATGKSRIRLKGSRIGWKYYSYDKQGARTSTQSGWNVATGQAWNVF